MPAINTVDGKKEWWVSGQRHRTDGPAVEHANGDKLWWANNQLHRTDGPAVEYADGDKEWFLEGTKLTETEHRDAINRSTDNNYDGLLVTVGGVVYELSAI